MTRRFLSNLLLFICISSLVACNPKNETKEEVEIKAPVEVSLADVIAHPRRDNDRARDPFRNPRETLEFFGVEPGKHVAEIWPGWYTEIIAPYLAANGGTYTAVLYQPSERTQPRIDSFKKKFGDATGGGDIVKDYGEIQYGTFGREEGAIMAPESADIILSFRNVHNWMNGGYAEKAFTDFYAALKPGGTLGIVEHRLPESALQDPRASTGYVQESYMKALAAEAGFEFVESSEINANPRDTADHPLGVWTLPPRSRVPEEGTEAAVGFEAELYKNIGESDRATLKFRKPGNMTGQE